jgi:peroxiredoxin
MTARPSLWSNKRFAVMIALGVLLIGAAIFIPLSNAADRAATNRTGSVLPGITHYPAPELHLTSLSGEPATLSDYLGQVVLVNNWATWCPPCRAEMPELLAYYQAHAAQGFVLIAISAGEPASVVQAFVDEFGLTFPVWLDPEMAALATFQNPNLPNSYVIDRDGVVRLAWTGPINRATLEEYVTPLVER